MPRFLSQSSIFVAILLAGTACTRPGDWPNLSDKIPDPAERSRVIERADPSSEPRPTPQVIGSEQDAAQLMSDVENSLVQLEAEFNTAMATWKQNDGEPRTDWMSAQVAVTRLSHAASQLDEILFSKPLEGSSTMREALTLKTRIDAMVIAARQELASNEPD